MLTVGFKPTHVCMFLYMKKKRGPTKKEKKEINGASRELPRSFELGKTSHTVDQKKKKQLGYTRFSKKVIRRSVIYRL